MRLAPVRWFNGLEAIRSNEPQSGVLYSGVRLTLSHGFEVIDLSTGQFVKNPSGEVKTETWLLLHGEPTWSFLYRNMIPPLLSSTGRPQGGPTKLVQRRIIALDLLGFGRSDKPVSMADIGFAFHLHSMIHVILELNLENITAVVQDWGGLLGLCLPVYLPGRFKRFVVMDTALPLGLPINPGFLKWKEYATKHMETNFVASSGMKYMMRESLETMTPSVCAAYDAPYPSFEYTAGAIKFPNMVPLDKSYEGTDVGAKAAEFWSKGDGLKVPIFMAIGMKDLVIEPRGTSPFSPLRWFGD